MSYADYYKRLSVLAYEVNKIFPNAGIEAIEPDGKEIKEIKKLKLIISKAQNEEDLYQVIPSLNGLLDKKSKKGKNHYRLINTSKTKTVGNSKPDFIMFCASEEPCEEGQKNVLGHMMYGEIKLERGKSSGTEAGQAFFFAQQGLEHHPRRTSCVCMLTDFKTAQFYQVERCSDKFSYRRSGKISFFPGKNKEKLNAISVLTALWDQCPEAFVSSFLIPDPQIWSLGQFLGVGATATVVQISKIKKKKKNNQVKTTLTVKIPVEPNAYHAKKEYRIYQKLTTNQNLSFAKGCKLIDLDLLTAKGVLESHTCLCLPRVLSPLTAGQISAEAICCIVDTLETAHNLGIFHCDIREPNIMSASRQEGVLIDWSAAMESVTDAPPRAVFNSTASVRVLNRTFSEYSAGDDLEALVHVVFRIVHPGHIFPSRSDDMRKCARFWTEQMLYEPWKTMVNCAREERYGDLKTCFKTCSCIPSSSTQQDGATPPPKRAKRVPLRSEEHEEQEEQEEVRSMRSMRSKKQVRGAKRSNKKARGVRK